MTAKHKIYLFIFSSNIYIYLSTFSIECEIINPYCRSKATHFQLNVNLYIYNIQAKFKAVYIFHQIDLIICLTNVNLYIHIFHQIWKVCFSILTVKHKIYLFIFFIKYIYLFVNIFHWIWICSSILLIEWICSSIFPILICWYIYIYIIQAEFRLVYLYFSAIGLIIHSLSNVNLFILLFIKWYIHII